MADPALRRNTGHISSKRFSSSDTEPLKPLALLFIYLFIFGLPASRPVFIGTVLRVTEDVASTSSRRKAPIGGRQNRSVPVWALASSYPLWSAPTTAFCPAAALFNP